MMRCCRRFAVIVGAVCVVPLGAQLPPGTTTRVSVASDGAPGNRVSRQPSISANGRCVAFASSADNLVEGDTNDAADVFVHDLDTGVTTRVSVRTHGTQGNADSLAPVISADGWFVAFRSDATNLVTGDTNGETDIFVHDRHTDTTTRVSVATGGTQANGQSWATAISADGRYIGFESFANNLVTGGDTDDVDVFVHDRNTGVTTQATVASDGTPGNYGGWHPAISADGRDVAFESLSTNLVAGDTNGHQDVFVHDRDTGATARVSLATDGTEGNDFSAFPTISADGRYVAFSSGASSLVEGDTNGQTDVFVHDRNTGVTTRVSVSSHGNQGNKEAGFVTISQDGRYVAFESEATNMVTGDTNGVGDVFVHDRETGATTRASVATNNIQGNKWSYEAAISADGRFVAFASLASNLVPGDANGATDVFVRAFTAEPPPRPTVTGVTPSSGPMVGGTAVKITGTGFNARTTVTFDSNPGTSVKFVSPRRLTAKSPAHALGAVSVTVKNDDGFDTLDAGFTYVAPQFNLTAIIPLYIPTKVLGHGPTLSFKSKTKNLGPDPAPESVTGIYLSKDGVVDLSDVLLTTYDVPALSSGDVHPATVQFVLPPWVKPGEYRMVVKADHMDALGEVTEGDNTRSTPAVVAKRTVFLVHGVASASAAMEGLAKSLRDPTFGLDPDWFEIDTTFDLPCGRSVSVDPGCTIEKAGALLAGLVKRRPSDVVLVGHSMGGLIARYVMTANLDAFYNGKAVASLVTLGSPAVGYPYCDKLDPLIMQKALVGEMASQLRTNPKVVSHFLFDQISGWNSVAVLRRPGGWLAAAGTYCQDLGRACEWNAVDKKLSQGCSDGEAGNDGVVCTSSALYDVAEVSRTNGDTVALSGEPPTPWSSQDYAHAGSGWWGDQRFWPFCGGATPKYTLVNPPVGGTLVQRIREFLHGILPTKELRTEDLHASNESWLPPAPLDEISQELATSVWQETAALGFPKARREFLYGLVRVQGAAVRPELVAWLAADGSASESVDRHLVADVLAYGADDATLDAMLTLWRAQPQKYAYHVGRVLDYSIGLRNPFELVYYALGADPSAAAPVLTWVRDYLKLGGAHEIWAQEIVRRRGRTPTARELARDPLVRRLGGASKELWQALEDIAVEGRTPPR